MKEVDPLTTPRAASWQLFKDALMPMVTIFKTLDITNITSAQFRPYKLNMLLCYCIGLAAAETPAFKLLPVGEKLFAYDKIGVNVIVANAKGGITSCDIPFSAALSDFNRDYLRLTEKAASSCENYEIADSAIIGTSALVKYDVDGIVNMYSGHFNNPFLSWGKYRRQDEKTDLKLSFQFHHVQFDGLGACAFLEKLQKTIEELTVQ